MYIHVQYGLTLHFIIIENHRHTCIWHDCTTCIPTYVIWSSELAKTFIISMKKFLVIFFLVLFLFSIFFLPISFIFILFPGKIYLQFRPYTYRCMNIQLYTCLSSLHDCVSKSYSFTLIHTILPQMLTETTNIWSLTQDRHCTCRCMFSNGELLMIGGVWNLEKTGFEEYRIWSDIKP